MISSTSTLLLASLVLNAASVYGAPIRVFDPRNVEVRNIIESIPQPVARSVLDIPVVRDIPVPVKRSHTRSVSRRKARLSREPGLQITEIRDTEVPKVAHEEPRKEHHQEQRNRQYPRRVYYEYYEKRVSVDGDGVKRQENKDSGNSNIARDDHHPRDINNTNPSCSCNPGSGVNILNDGQFSSVKLQNRCPCEQSANTATNQQVTPETITTDAGVPVPTILISAQTITDTGIPSPTNVPTNADGGLPPQNCVSSTGAQPSLPALYSNAGSSTDTPIGLEVNTTPTTTIPDSAATSAPTAESATILATLGPLPTIGGITQQQQPGSQNPGLPPSDTTSQSGAQSSGVNGCNNPMNPMSATTVQGDGSVPTVTNTGVSGSMPIPCVNSPPCSNTNTPVTPPTSTSTDTPQNQQTGTSTVTSSTNPNTSQSLPGTPGGSTPGADPSTIPPGGTNISQLHRKETESFNSSSPSHPPREPPEAQLMKGRRQLGYSGPVLAVLKRRYHTFENR